MSEIVVGSASSYIEVSLQPAFQIHTRCNKAHMREWIAELRSGTWTQHKGTLAGADNVRCAMGVAFEAAGLVPMNADYPALRGWLGTDCHVPFLKMNEDTFYDVIAANDKAGWDFGRIADELEKMYVPEDVVPADVSSITDKEAGSEHGFVNGNERSERRVVLTG